MKFIFTCREKNSKLTLHEFKLYDKSFVLEKELFTAKDGSYTALANTELDLPDLAALIRRSPIIFVWHIHRVDEIAEKTDFADKVIELCRKRLDKTIPFSVQLRSDSNLPRTSEAKELSQRLEALGFLQDMKYCKQVVSLTAAGSKVYIGIDKVENNLSKWKGGIPYYSRHSKFGFVSRAEYKLMEAAECFDLNLSDCRNGLDLGAAPGGWTKALLDAGVKMISVDPQPLDENILQSPYVSFKKMTAERYIAQKSNEKFDILTNDMKMDADKSVSLTSNFFDRLNFGAVAVITLKLAESFSYKEIQNAIKELEEAGYTLLGARQLFHNRSEITVVLKKIKAE